jgi:hypothetical protein
MVYRIQIQELSFIFGPVAHGINALNKAMFVSRKVVSGKPLSKLFCVYLSLENVVNEKYFPAKEKFDLVSRKVFFLLAVFVFWKVVSRKSLSKLLCVCLPLEKLVNEKHFPVKEKFDLVFRKVFSWKIWAENTFLEVVKNLEMSLFADYIKFDPQTFDCYIYFVLNIYFLISSLKI